MGVNPAEIAGKGISLINSLKNVFLGAKQVHDGKKLQSKLDAQGRPILETPEAFKEVEGLVRSNYLDPRLMGEDRMKDAIKAQGANQIQNIQQTAGSGADALLAYGMSNAQTDKGVMGVDMRAYEQQRNDYKNFLDTLGQKAGFEGQQFEANVMQPFVQSTNQAKALVSSGQQNINNGMNDLSSMTQLMPTKKGSEAPPPATGATGGNGWQRAQPAETGANDMSEWLRKILSGYSSATGYKQKSSSSSLLFPQ